MIAIAVRNVQLFLETREHSLRDTLTNCFNRGHALDTLEGELRRSRHSPQPLSILMEDEPGVRGLIRVVLGRAGHEVNRIVEGALSSNAAAR